MPKSLVIIVTLLLVALGIGRISYGRFVASPAFKSTLEHEIAAAARGFAPGIKVTIASVTATGVAGIKLTNVVLKAGAQSLKAQQIDVKPGYLAALFGKSVPFSVDAILQPGTALSAVGTITRQQYASLDIAAIQLTSNLLNVDAMPLINARFGTSDKANKSAQMVSGTLTGQFQMKNADKTMSGGFDGTLQKVEWRLGGAGGRGLKLEPTALKFTFDDHNFRLAAPFIAMTPLGKLSISGSMTFGDQTNRWDMTVDAQNNPILRMAAGTLFRCQSVPGTGNFRVTGTTTTPTCQ